MFDELHQQNKTIHVSQFIADDSFLMLPTNISVIIQQLRRYQQEQYIFKATVRRDEVEFTSKFMQSICSIKSTQLPKDPSYFESLVESLITMESFISRGVKTDIKVLIMKIMAFAGENGHLDEGLFLSKYYFSMKSGYNTFLDTSTSYFFSSEQLSAAGIGPLSQTAQDSNLQVNQQESKKEIEKQLFVLVSRVKLLLRKLESDQSTNSTSSTFSTNTKLKLNYSSRKNPNQMELNNEVKAMLGIIEKKLKNGDTFTKEYVYLQHRVIVSSLRDNQRIDFNQSIAFYTKHFLSNSLQMDNFSAMLVDLLNQSKAAAKTTAFEKFLIQQMVIQNIHTLSSSPSPGQQINATSLNSIGQNCVQFLLTKPIQNMLEILCFQLEDVQLMEKLASILTLTRINKLVLISSLLRVSAALKRNKETFYQKQSLQNKNSLISDQQLATQFAEISLSEKINLEFCEEYNLSQKVSQETQSINKDATKIARDKHQNTHSFTSILKDLLKCPQNEFGKEQIAAASTILAYRIFNQIQDMKSETFNKIIEPRAIFKRVEVWAKSGIIKTKEKSASLVHQENTSNSYSSSTNISTGDETSETTEISFPSSDLMNVLEIQNAILWLIDPSEIDRNTILSQNLFTLFLFQITTFISTASTETNLKDIKQLAWEIFTSYSPYQNQNEDTLNIVNQNKSNISQKNKDNKNKNEKKSNDSSQHSVKQNKEKELRTFQLEYFLRTGLCFHQAGMENQNQQIIQISYDILSVIMENLQATNDIEFLYNVLCALSNEQINEQFKLSTIVSISLSTLTTAITLSSQSVEKSVTLVLNCLSIIDFIFLRDDSDSTSTRSTANLLRSRFLRIEETLIEVSPDIEEKYTSSAMDTLARFVFNNKRKINTITNPNHVISIPRAFEKYTQLFMRILKRNSKNPLGQIRYLISYMEFSDWVLGFLKDSLPYQFQDSKQNQSNVTTTANEAFQIVNNLKRSMIEHFTQFLEHDEANPNETPCSNSQEIINYPDDIAFNRIQIQILSRLSAMIDEATSNSSLDKITLKMSIVNKILYLYLENQMKSLYICNSSSNVYEFGAFYQSAISHLINLGDTFRIFLETNLHRFEHSHTFVIGVLCSEASIRGSPLQRIFTEFCDSLRWIDLSQLLVCLRQSREQSIYFKLPSVTIDISVTEILIYRFIKYLSLSNAQSKENDHFEKYVYRFELRYEESLETYIEALSSLRGKREIEEASKISSFIRQNSCINEVKQYRKDQGSSSNSNQKYSKEIPASSSKSNNQTNSKTSYSKSNSKHYQQQKKYLDQLKMASLEVQVIRMDNGRKVEGILESPIPNITELVYFADKIENNIKSTGQTSQSLDAILLSLRVHLISAKALRELNQPHDACRILERAFRKLTSICFDHASGMLTDILSQQPLNNFSSRQQQHNPIIYTSTKFASSPQIKQLNIFEKIAVSQKKKVDEIDNIQLEQNSEQHICILDFLSASLEKATPTSSKRAQVLLLRSLDEYIRIQKAMNLFTTLKTFSRLYQIVASRFLLFDAYLSAMINQIHCEKPSYPQSSVGFHFDLANTSTPVGDNPDHASTSQDEGTSVSAHVIVDVIGNILQNPSKNKNNQPSHSLNSLFNRRKSQVAQMQLSTFIKTLDAKIIQSQQQNIQAHHSHQQSYNSQSSSQIWLNQTRVHRKSIKFMINLFTSTVRPAHRNLESEMCSLLYFSRYHHKNPSKRFISNICDLIRQIIAFKSEFNDSSLSTNQVGHNGTIEVGQMSCSPQNLTKASLTDQLQNNQEDNKNGNNTTSIVSNRFADHFISHRHYESSYLRYSVLLQSLNLLSSMTSCRISSDESSPHRISTKFAHLFISMINFREICKLMHNTFLAFHTHHTKQFSYLFHKFDETIKDLLRERQTLLLIYQHSNVLKNCNCVGLSESKALLLPNGLDLFLIDSLLLDSSYSYKRASINSTKQVPQTKFQQEDNNNDNYTLNQSFSFNKSSRKNSMADKNRINIKETNSSNKNNSNNEDFEFKKLRSSLHSLNLPSKRDRKSMLRFSMKQPPKGERTSLARGLQSSLKHTRLNVLMQRQLKFQKLKLEHDIVIVNFLDYNNERVVVIHKYNYLQKSNTSFRITSASATDLFADLLADVKRIFSVNESEMKTDERKRKSQIDPNAWWKSRNSNDKQLTKILSSLASIFDFYMPLFFGSENEAREQQFFSDIQMHLQNCEEVGGLSQNSQSDDELIILSPEKENLIEMLFSILKCCNFMKINDSKFKAIFQSLCLHNIYLQYLGQQSQQYLFSQMSKMREDAVKYEGTSNRKPTLWMLSENLYQIPLESMPCFPENNQTFYRIPSIDYLCENYSVNNKVNFSNNYYLVNPSGDLTNTQAKFQSKFESIKEWEGVSGFSVSSSELQRVLKQYDSYTYIGHGAGELYLSFKQIEEIDEIKSAILLFGCQSAKQVIQLDPASPMYETTGISLYFLINRCKLLIGSLWDITDRDTDRMVLKLLSIFQKATQDKPIEFTRAFLQARDECRLKQLNGSSFVTFGIPTYFYMR